ncbi:MAG: DoxX family membrane protein [Candidatus Taylorbacteria bacterium]
MQKFISFIELYSPSVLRYGMVAVILWFSLQQLINASAWTAFVPDSIVSISHMDATVLVYFNALFELVFGLMLLFGWQTRLAALLLSLHLFDIMWVVGYGEIGVRDLGLAVATFVVFMNGPDLLCIQRKQNQINYLR